MSLKKYISLSVFVIIINLISVFNLIFVPWSIIYLLFAIFIVKNRDSDKLLRDKKIIAFIQAFMIIAFTFIFTVFSLTLYLFMYHFVQSYLSEYFYLFLVIGIIGLISFYYLFVKLYLEAFNVLRQKEIST